MARVTLEYGTEKGERVGGGGVGTVGIFKSNVNDTYKDSEV